MSRPATIIMAIAIILFTATVEAAAQSAAPNRIRFAKGSSSATVSETLSGDEEYDMVFGAKKGQRITMSVRSDAGPSLFNFTFMGDGFDVASDDDEPYTMTSLLAPETGDYLVTVRKNPKAAVRTARFYFTLKIE